MNSTKNQKTNLTTLISDNPSVSNAVANLMEYAERIYGDFGSLTLRNISCDKNSVSVCCSSNKPSPVGKLPQARNILVKKYEENKGEVYIEVSMPYKKEQSILDSIR